MTIDGQKTVNAVTHSAMFWDCAAPDLHTSADKIRKLPESTDAFVSLTVLRNCLIRESFDRGLSYNSSTGERQCVLWRRKNKWIFRDQFRKMSDDVGKMARSCRHFQKATARARVRRAINSCNDSLQTIYQEIGSRYYVENQCQPEEQYEDCSGGHRIRSHRSMC